MQGFLTIYCIESMFMTKKSEIYTIPHLSSSISRQIKIINYYPVRVGCLMMGIEINTTQRTGGGGVTFKTMLIIGIFTFRVDGNDTGNGIGDADDTDIFDSQ